MQSKVKKNKLQTKKKTKTTTPITKLQTNIAGSVECRKELTLKMRASCKSRRTGCVVETTTA